MAWLKWRGTPARGRWYVVWTEGGRGRRRKRYRVAGRTRAIAELVRREVEANLARQGVGLGLVVRLSVLRDSYLQLLAANGGAPGYLTRVRVVLAHLERYYPGIMVPAITPQMLDNYKLRRRQDGIAAPTINRELGVIKAAVRKGRRWQYQIQDLSDVAPVRGQETVRATFSAEQIRTMLEAANDTLRLVIRLGLYAGLRRSEILQLRWSNVNYEEQTLVLGNGWKTKTGAARALPLHPALEAELRGRDHGTDAAALVLPWSATPHALTARFTYFLRRRCGIAHGTIHTLRHTFVTALKRKDVDTGKIMRAAGHKTERVTQGYTHLVVADLKDGIERLDYEKSD